MSYDTKPYIETIKNYRSTLEDALGIANDPFKAPEVTVGTSKRVMEACWAMQIEYSAMLRHHDNVKED